MTGCFAALVMLAGAILILAGVFGIWLTMNSPIQLQPMPLIALIVGIIIFAFGVGLLGVSP